MSYEEELEELTKTLDPFTRGMVLQAKEGAPPIRFNMRTNIYRAMLELNRKEIQNVISMRGYKVNPILFERLVKGLTIIELQLFPIIVLITNLGVLRFRKALIKSGIYLKLRKAGIKI